MTSLFEVPLLSALIDNISYELPLFLDLTHEMLKKKRPVSSHPHAFRHRIKCKFQPYFSKEPAIDDQQQSIQRPWRQKMQNFIFNLSIPKLFLPINLLSMRPNTRGSLSPHILALQLIDQLKMVMPPLIIVAENINQQPQDLSHQISEYDGDGDEDEDHEDALNWIFGGDIPVGYGCDNCDTEIHDVGVHLRPGQDESHVVEGPAVVDPAEVGSVGSVVIVAVDPVADQVEGYPHVVSVDNEDDCQLDAQVGGVQGYVELCHALELDIDAGHRVKLDQPEHFEPIGVQSIDKQRDDYCQPRSHVNDYLKIEVAAEDDRDIRHKQSLLVVRLQRRNEHIQQKHKHKQQMYAQDVVHLCPPELIAETNEEPYLQNVEDHYSQDHCVPNQQKDVLWSDYDAKLRVEVGDELKRVFGWR